MGKGKKGYKGKGKIGITYDISLEERNELVRRAERYFGYESLYVWNANLNGIVIQLRTNSEHLYDFWQANWFPASLNHSLRPHGVIYAVVGIPDTEPKICYHSDTKTGVVMNTDFYDNVRSLALGMALDIVGGEKGINFLRGSLIDVDGEGIVITGCSQAGKSTHTYLLLELERARIHSNDWTYVERLGGEKGRLSTLVSERKFYIKTEIAKINLRLKELSKKCKHDESHFMLDPWWIGGNEKFVDTTRIKLIFILRPDPASDEIVRRLDAEEALELLINSPEPFCNPHLIAFKDQMEIQREFFKDLLNFASCYTFNTAKPLFEVQKVMQRIISTREYTRPITKAPVVEKVKRVKPKVDFGEIKRAVKKLCNQHNVIHPEPEELRKMAERYGAKTKFGNYNFVSTVKNRSAGLTVYVGSPKVRQEELNPKQEEIIKKLPNTLKEVHEYIKKAPFVCVERTMGDNPYFTPHCTLYVSTHRKEMVRLAHMINQTLFDKREGPGPELFIIYIPEWQEKDRQILVFPEIGVTYILGTDYYGEAKKGFLRMAMWYAKQEGILGLHAGAKILKAKDAKSGKIKRYSMIIFGLTATGKTTHSCHDHGLNLDGEGIEIAQDDVVFLRPDCSVLGTEKGFYLKTEGVSPEIQPLIYNAVTKPDAIFENVMVDYLGNVYFGDETLTGNGRGIMQRDDFGEFKSESVNLPPVDELDGMIIAFITRRNTVVPIAAELTLEQAAAAFMLGESIETSGSDPKRAGESVREVGTNPFIVGDYSEEGNIFYEFIKKHPKKIRCYLLNTGGVGELIEEQENGTKVIRRKVTRVEIPEMASIIRGIARGNIEWVREPNFKMKVPKKVEGVDMSKFEISKYYTKEQIKEYVKKLKKERIEWLEQFPGLNPAIVNSIRN